MKLVSFILSLQLLFPVSFSHAADVCTEKSDALRRDFFVCAQSYGTDFCFDYIIVDQKPEQNCAAYIAVCVETCELSYSREVCSTKCKSVE